MDPLTKAQRYLQRAEECIALAKVATSNKVRAHHYAIAERYVSLAQAEPKVANQDAGSDRDHTTVAPSATS
jgi:type II secretory pathway component HofQ